MRAWRMALSATLAGMALLCGAFAWWLLNNAPSGTGAGMVRAVHQIEIAAGLALGFGGCFLLSLSRSE